MEEELNILSEEEIDNLFTDNNGTQETPPAQLEQSALLIDAENNSENNLETTEVDVENLFTEPESVGSEDNQGNKESTKPKGSTSPNNFYSSNAAALRDSTFPDLDITNITDADSFAESFEKMLQNRLDERQRRIDEALNNGVEPSEIRKYEGLLKQLNSVKPEDISDNLGEQGENLRKNLIYRDLINKGYSLEDAAEELNEIFESGNDIKRAERALKSNLSFYKKKYDDLLQEAKDNAQLEQQNRKQLAEELRKDILSNTKAFGDIEISLQNRQKAYDAISKPIYKDPDTGDYLTAIQKYEMEHRLEFLKNLGLLFVLTDNFSNLNNLIKGKVNKESRKAIRELENTLNNTRRTSDGTLQFASGVSEDPESIFKGYTLDV